jgi:predicted DsbA family dithiol-disulfide isomerase
MKVEIWSDVVCPWCYIGKRRFESALAHFDHRGEVEVEFRSFELNPNANAADQGNLEEALARKYGMSLEQAHALHARVIETAAGEGLQYRLDIAKRGNTFDAHRLIHLAGILGLQGAMKERLLAAYFTEGKPIGDHDTLVELAAEVGIDADRARTVLADGSFGDQVREDEREATELGITGVPFFVINRRYGVSGAQPPELMLKALTAGWESSETTES